MNEEQLADIEARANAATPGPWEADLDIFDSDEGVEACVTCAKIDLFVRIPVANTRLPKAQEWTAALQAEFDAQWNKAKASQELRDADFIASARTDIPALVLALREAWKERDSAIAEVDRMFKRVEALKARLEEMVRALEEIASRAKSPCYHGCDSHRVALLTEQAYSDRLKGEIRDLKADLDSLRLRAERAEGELERARAERAQSHGLCDRCGEEVRSEIVATFTDPELVVIAAELYDAHLKRGRWMDVAEKAVEMIAPSRLGAKSALGEGMKASEPSEQDILELTRVLFDTRDPRGDSTPWRERYHAMAKAMWKLGARAKP